MPRSRGSPRSGPHAVEGASATARDVSTASGEDCRARILRRATRGAQAPQKALAVTRISTRCRGEIPISRRAGQLTPRVGTEREKSRPEHPRPPRPAWPRHRALIDASVRCFRGEQPAVHQDPSRRTPAGIRRTKSRPTARSESTARTAAGGFSARSSGSPPARQAGSPAKHTGRWHEPGIGFPAMRTLSPHRQLLRLHSPCTVRAFGGTCERRSRSRRTRSPRGRIVAVAAIEPVRCVVRPSDSTSAIGPAWPRHLASRLTMRVKPDSLSGLRRGSPISWSAMSGSAASAEEWRQGVQVAPLACVIMRRLSRGILGLASVSAPYRGITAPPGSRASTCDARAGAGWSGDTMRIGMLPGSSAAAL